MWGVGASTGPYIMSYALVHSVWMDGYRMVSYIQITIAFVILIPMTSALMTVVILSPAIITGLLVVQGRVLYPLKHVRLPTGCLVLLMV